MDGRILHENLFDHFPPRTMFALWLLVLDGSCVASVYAQVTPTVEQSRAETFLCCVVSTVKNHSKFVINFSASQPPTTLPPPTTEAIETTTQRRVVNFIPPIGQTTMLYTVNMLDKGTLTLIQVHTIIRMFCANLKTIVAFLASLQFDYHPSLFSARFEISSDVQRDR